MSNPTKEAAEALLNQRNEERALWRIISELDEELYKELRDYRFGNKPGLRSEIESKLQELDS